MSPFSDTADAEITASITRLSVEHKTARDIEQTAPYAFESRLSSQSRCFVDHRRVSVVAGSGPSRVAGAELSQSLPMPLTHTSHRLS